jgi:EmrB/QacA subfamily drug resistance transporter
MATQTPALPLQPSADLFDDDRSDAIPGRLAAFALPVLLAWQLMVLLDASIVNIALSDIRESLNFSTSSLSWVVNAYALAFGGLLLLGGRAGDILGRRRMLVYGVVVFTAASILGGMAQSAEMLLASRVLQGVGAAMAAPSTLSLIYTNFSEADERNRALGLYGAVSGVGASMGLILGGVLTSALSWHWIFFINVPIGIAVAVVAPRALKESPRNPGRFDLGGAALSTGGVTAIVYGFIRASESSWTEGWTLASFGAGVLLLIGLVLQERRAAQPIMPLSMFHNRPRVVALGNMLLVAASMFSVFFFVTQYLQIVHGYSSLRAGVAFLPLSLSVLVAARLSARLVGRFGTRTMMIAGATSLMTGLLWLTQASVTDSYWLAVMPAFILVGLGGGSSFIPTNLLIMSTLRAEQTGAGAGTLQTFQQVGGAVGLAVLVSVFTAGQDRAIGDGVAPLTAFGDGLTWAFWAGAGLAALAIVNLTVNLRGRDVR